jgi:hypothetical protein
MSAILARRLEEALRRKETAESYKANLQRLQAEGTVNPENYARMLEGYDRSVTEASRELSELGVLIAEEIRKSERELAGARDELARLQVRRNVGELNDRDFERSARPLERRIHALEASRELCAKLQVAKGTVDLPSTNTRTVGGTAGTSIFGSRQIAIPDSAAFTQFSSIEEMTTPRLKALGLASGMLLLISVLAKWVSSDVSATIAGSDVSRWLLVVGFVGAAVGIYGSLLVLPRARGLLHLGVAAIGLIVFVGVLLAFNYKSVTVIELGGTTIQMGRGTIRFREGFYLYLVAIAAMAYYGFKEATSES